MTDMLIGIDIAEISRFENMSESLIKKCFTEEEAVLFKGKKASASAAANFAAKEAFSKALGTGVRGFSLTDISVLRNELGKPYFKLSPCLSELLRSLGVKEAELSVSHDGGIAAATVVLLREKKLASASVAAEKTKTDDCGIISYSDLKKSIKPRKPDTHKGDYGKTFVVAGSKGLTGAAILASKAVLKSGGGLITLGCCESLNAVFEVSLHEVMTLPLADNTVSLSKKCTDTLIDKANSSSVLLFGCGLSRDDDIRCILEAVLKNVKVPMVIDADGLNALSENIDILKEAKAPVVLTPHIGEFSRLSGLSADEILADTERLASDFAKKHNVTLVLKSSQTVVAKSDGSVKRNILGNPGMATGGSGDVLAGVIASFIGQGIENAAESGVYIHSLAADIASSEKGCYGETPTDIIECLPYAIKYFAG